MCAPSRSDLVDALTAAGAAHHDFETRALKGVRDDQWAGWYAAYVLGRLGDFALPTDLAAWLSEADGADWAAAAADVVLARIG